MTLCKINHCCTITPGFAIQKEQGVPGRTILVPCHPFALFDILKSNKKITARKKIISNWFVARFSLTYLPIFKYIHSNLIISGCIIPGATAHTQLSMAYFYFSREHKAPSLHTQSPRGRTLIRRGPRTLLESSSWHRSALLDTTWFLSLFLWPLLGLPHPALISSLTLQLLQVLQDPWLGATSQFRGPLGLGRP